MPPTGHALLSASSAHRWLECTAAPRFEQQFEGGTSVYAEEGTLAHEICEVTARHKFKGLPTDEYEKTIAELMSNKLFSAEMLNTAAAYCDYLLEKAQTYDAFPHLDFEVKVDLTDWIPQGFGTCDCIMIGGDNLHITDYKHGKGVEVSAVENPQMMLYALGALRKYRMIFGDSIKHVSMGICQPRITMEPSEYTLTADELLAWGSRIKPIAREAYDGPGHFKAGEHCKFCRGKVACRARANAMLAAQDFAGLALPNTATPPKDPDQRRVLGLPPIITNEEIAEALRIGKGLVDWYTDLCDYAKQALLDGQTIPGFKVVAGKSNRVFSQPEEEIQKILKGHGFTDEQIFKPREQRSLSDLEKQMGRKAFGELLGQYVTKPLGKPALAEESDKRPPYSSAAADFANVPNE